MTRSYGVESIQKMNHSMTLILSKTESLVSLLPYIFIEPSSVTERKVVKAPPNNIEMLHTMRNLKRMLITSRMSNYHKLYK